MKFVPDAISSKVARQALVGQKNSPTILLVGGVAGILTATVLACRATLKLEEVLTATHDNLELAHTLESPQYSEDDRKKDIAYIHVRNVVKITKLYGPAVLIGAASIAALAGSHRILTKRNAALTVAYKTLEKGFDEYRGRVREKLGEDKEYDLYHNIHEEETIDPDTGKKTKTRVASSPNDPSIYARFFDEYNRNWQKQPEYNKLFLRAQQNYANDLLKARGHVFLNEVYDMLGMEHSGAGAVCGWVVSCDGDNYIDFGIFDGNDFKKRQFVNGEERSILLDFNVDGIIYDLI